MLFKEMSNHTQVTQKAQEILSSLDENLITLGSTRQLFLQEDLTLSKSQLNTK